MQTIAADREDLSRLADDGGPTPPTREPDDLAELWRDLGGSD
jgi:hypothetical protein